MVATAAGAGLRWGEVVGLRADAIDLERARLSVIRTVTEVAGHTSFKPFPKSAAGRRTVPLPAWLVPIIREHRARWPTASDGPVFANEVGCAAAAHPVPLAHLAALARAGRATGRGRVGGRRVGGAVDRRGGRDAHRAPPVGPQAVQHVARHQAGGLRFHDLRHSYATWLVDDGVPPNMVQRVMGHERSSTTLDLYTRRTDNSEPHPRRAQRPGRPDHEDPDDDGSSALYC